MSVEIERKIPRVAHLELGMHLYGGAEQVRYLLGALNHDRGKHWLLTPHGSALHSWASEARQPVIGLAFAGEHDIRFVWRLAGILRRHEITVLHIHSRRGADWMGALAAKLAGIPAVLSRRVDNPPSAWQRWLMGRAFARVICISDAIRDVLVSAGVDSAHLLTIRSSVNAKRYQLPAAEHATEALVGGPHDGPIIAVLAQLIERKGHRFLLSELTRLYALHPDIKVVFLGRGPMAAALRATVASNGHDDLVHFAGFRDDLPHLLQRISLVVHPALTEGLGVSLLQVGAAGIPVVAFAAGGVPEVVRDQHSGLLVEIGDAQALGDAISLLLTDDALRRRMGDNARERIERDFSVAVMAKRHEALYDVLGEEQV